MYYVMIALLILIVGQLSKIISFKQALNIPLNSADYFICVLAGVVVIGVTVGIKVVVEKNYWWKLKDEGKKKENEKGGQNEKRQ